MRLLTAVAVALLGARLLAVPAAADDACCCDDGLRIKFFDDLLYGDDPDADPYEERIETERHDFTQTTKTVGRGVMQLEGGYSYFYKDHEDEIEQSHTGPEMMLRMGLSENIEFRVRWNYVWQFVDVADNRDSAEDLRLALKLGISDEECWIPESALEVRFTAPTGGSALSTEGVEFGLDYIYGWELCEGWELSASTGFGTNGFGDFSLLPDAAAADNFMLWSQSVALGIHLTEKTTMYAEFYGLFSYGLADEFTVGIFNIGVDYYVSDNFVLDVRSGVGLTGDSDDFFAGVGGGYRF